MLPQLSLFQQCSIQSQDVMQTWLHWRRQDALNVQKHFVALFHPKPNECLRFDLENCNLMCTYTVTHPCRIPQLAQARPMMLCIYTSIIGASLSEPHTSERTLDFSYIYIYIYILLYICRTYVFRKCKFNSFNPNFAHADPCGRKIENNASTLN